MAEGVSADQIAEQYAAPAKPMGVSADQLAMQYSAPQSAPVPQGVSADELAQKYSNPYGVPQAALQVAQHPFPTANEVTGSPVGRALAPLAVPLKAETGAVIRGLDKLGVSGIQQTLNPQNKAVPDAMISDVTDFMIDRAASKLNMMPTPGSFIDSAYKTAKLGIGMAANFIADPLAWTGLEVGQMTEDAQNARKIGDFSNTDRNLVSVQLPGMSSPKGIPAAPVTDAISSAAQKASELVKGVPGATTVLNAGSKVISKASDAANTVLDALNYQTGNPDIDTAATVHAGKTRGDFVEIKQSFVDPNAAKKFSDDEKSVISRMVENTPNIAPMIPEQVINAAKGKLSATEDWVAAQMRQIAPKLFDGLDLKPQNLVAGRLDSMIDTAMDIKRQNALDLEERFQAGLFTPENAQQGVIENYLVHKMNPAYKGMEAKYAASLEEADLAKAVDKAGSGTYLSRNDPGSFQRKINGSIEEANQIMEQKTGIKDYFISDPVLSTGMKRLETRKLLRDKELLDVVEKYGIPKNVARARGLDFEPIPHPEFEGKVLQYADKNGNMKTMKLQDMVFPKNIATKMTYYMIPRQTGNFPAFMDSYNRVFRTTALANPGYYLRNWAENVAKNYVQGVKLEDYSDALKVFSEKPGKVNVNGRMVDTSEVKNLMQQLGVQTGGQFKEGLSDALYMGKKASLKLSPGALKQAVYDTFNGLRHFGERGENWTRSALFLNRLKAGYSPEMSAVEVEKFLFDFNRNSPAVDQVRRFAYPFIQHALKTAYIAPEMIGKSAATYNLIHNTMLKTLANAFNDPLTQQELTQIIPDYRKFQDVVAGPLMPGNTWLGGIFGNEKLKGPLGQMVYFRAAMGMDILNHFALFSDQMAKQGYNLSPLIRAFVGAVSGQDPFTRKSVDINPNHPSSINRLNYFLQTAMEGDIVAPNLFKIMKGAFGIGDPKYLDPKSVLALNGSFGQFGGVINLDREYLFRMMAFATARKELMSKLASAVVSEANSKTLDIQLADKPEVVRKLYGAVRTASSADIYHELLNQAADAQKTQMARGYLQGQYQPAKLGSMIKNLDQTIQNANENYQVLKQRYFEMAKGSKNAAEARARILEEMNH